MKKLFIILITFLMSGTCFAQFAKPTGSVTISTYQMFRTPQDSGVHIYQGSTLLYNSFLMKWDSVKVKGYATNYKLLSYLQKRDTTLNRYGYIPFYRYQFLMLKNDSSKLYKLKTDSTAADGYTRRDRLATELFFKVPKTLTITATAPITIAGTTSADLSANRTIAIIPSTQSVAGSMSATDKAKVDNLATTYEPLISKSTGFLKWSGSAWVWDTNTYTNAYLPNDTWVYGYNYAGDLVPLYKLSKDNLMTFAPKLNVGSLYTVADAGKVVIADMPNLNSAANDTLQYSFRIGGVEMLKMRVIAAGSGSAADTTLILGGKLKWPGNPTTGYYLKVMPNGIIKPQPNTATYLGTWNAATNSPTLADGTGVAGTWYRTVVKGVWGADSARVGSDIYYSGTVWQVIPNATFFLQTATKTILGGVKLDSTSVKYNGSGQISVKTDYVENATHSGDVTGSTALTLATVNSNVGTYTKVTINAKGLATAGAAATTADIADGTNKRYVTDANITLLGNTSGTNSGDNAANTQYSGLVTNATHSGDAEGATSLTVKKINGVALSGLTTGILKNTTTTGVPSIAVAGDFPALNQSTTGTAAGLTAQYIDWNNTTGGSSIANKPTLGTLSLDNDQFLQAKSYSGEIFNLIKVSKDNMVTVPNLAVKSFYFVKNSGVNNLGWIPIDASANGIEQGYELWAGNKRLMKLYGLGTSGGEIDSARAVFENVYISQGAALNKIAMSEDSRGKVRWSDTKYLFNLVKNRILFASDINEMGQLPLGTSGQLMQSGGANTPTWTTPTYPNTATSGKVLIGDGTNIILSTPTFPNASATFNKVIKSDGTNWVSSTETYAAPGTSGYVMVSNGANWTSSAKNLDWDKWAQWDGGSTGLTATTGRTSLGGSTIGQAMFTLTNPSTISFLQLNADNSVTAKNATDFRTAIGAQATLISGTNIRTVNGNTLLGSTDLSTVQTTVSGNAGTVTVTDDNTTNSVYYPLWATGTGSIAPKISTTKFIFNPATGDIWHYGNINMNGTVARIGIMLDFGTAGQTLMSGGPAGNIYWGSAGTGTVTSVAMTTPTGLSISGSPITSSGTLGLTLTAGYVIPTTTEETNWGTAYTNRITSLTTTGSSGAATLSGNTLNIPQYSGGSGMTWPAAAGIAVYSGSSSWGTSITNNSTNWNTAYGWGDWRHTTLAGYGITDVASGAEVNVNADWNATSGDAQILNKPTIPTVPNLTVQALSGTSVSWNCTSGINATLTLSGTTTVTLSNVVAGTSGNIKITNPSGAANILNFALSGKTVIISPAVYVSSGRVSTSGASKIDMYSWYYDGTNLIFNGSNDYK